jgi:hypothetical protein
MKKNKGTVFSVERDGVFPLSFLSLLCFLLTTCASITSPQGGPRDETPPELVPEKSTPNLQTNFVKQEIELTFNEWVQLQDEFRQIVISPPLEFRPEVKLRGKKLILEFDENEELKPEVTYTINFGEAVQDLTERNPAENLRFVFSTGDVIDSLSLTGSITDAFTGEPVERALFMLYVSTEDSVVYKEKPYYFGRTDEAGNFRIQNVRSGTFKGFALLDGNLNYLYDQANEKIGFPPKPVSINDSVSPVLDISLFDERPPMLLARTDSSRYGLLKLVFNQPPNEVTLSPDSDLVPFFREVVIDTLYLWYDLPTRERTTLFLNAGDTLNFDTISFLPPDRDTFLTNTELRRLNRIGRNQNPFKPLRFEFNHPLARVDTAGIQVFGDSLPLDMDIIPLLDSSRQRQLDIRFDWEEDSTYTVLLLPGSVTDLFGLELEDTLSTTLKIEPVKKYGAINLSFINFPQDSSYRIDLMTNDRTVETFSLSGVAEFEKRLEGLAPGTYSLLIIEDINQNGRWDPGNYLTGFLPERVIRREIPALRANWEVDFTLDFSAPPPPPAPPDRPDRDREGNGDNR